MDKIYNYHTPIRGHQKTRWPLEKFIFPLTEFFDEFTNIKLEKLLCVYRPARLSNPDLYKHWLKLCSNGFASYPMETDEEIDNTIKNIESLNVITKAYDNIVSPNEEEHRYEIDINCYNDVLKLVKSKCNSDSYIVLQIKEMFDLRNYDYSEIKKELPWLSPNPDTNNPNGMANEIYVYITAMPDKYYQNISFDFYCPKPFEEEKEYFLKIKNKLKINFIAKYFGVYQKNNKGKWKHKREIIEI